MMRRTGGEGEMDDLRLRAIANAMVTTLPKWGHWADSIREFETPWGQVGYRQLELLWVLRHELVPREVRTPTRLAGYFRVQPSVLTGVVGRLEQGGFVTRSSDPVDSRVSIIDITDDGIAVSSYVEAYFVQQVFEVLQDLEPQRIDAIAAAVETFDEIVTHLVDMEPPKDSEVTRS